MGISAAEYEETSSLLVDWDLQLHRVELEVQKTRDRLANQ
jgi:hypothetical protein